MTVYTVHLNLLQLFFFSFTDCIGLTIRNAKKLVNNVEILSRFVSGSS